MSKTLIINSTIESDLRLIRMFVGLKMKTREEFMYYSTLTKLVNDLSQQD